MFFYCFSDKQQECDIPTYGNSGHHLVPTSSALANAAAAAIQVHFYFLFL
jgi:hypothetical protein